MRLFISRLFANREFLGRNFSNNTAPPITTQSISPRAAVVAKSTAFSRVTIQKRTA